MAQRLHVVLRVVLEALVLRGAARRHERLLARGQFAIIIGQVAAGASRLLDIYTGRRVFF